MKETGHKLKPPIGMLPGCKGILNDGSTYEVISYEGTKAVTVRLFGGVSEYVVTTTAHDLVRGSVKNRMKPSVFGVGVTGDRAIKKSDPIYWAWRSMLCRVYKPSSPQTQRAYANCSVCPEWLYLPNFAKWFNGQVRQDGYEVDKDLLVKRNREYGPTTCLLLPKQINSFLVGSYQRQGEYPIGVCFEKSRGCFRAEVHTGKQRKFLGRFGTPEEAFHAYKIAKESYAKELAETWRPMIDSRAYEALMAFEVDMDN